jgi:serine/threonine-protein kinase RsbT
MWKKGWRCCAATLASQTWTRIPVLKTEKISVAASGDIVAMRHAVRRQAVKINLSLVDQTKIVTAASELARNMLLYGGGGEVTLGVLQEGVRHGLRVDFVDDGPGIPNIDLALRDGFTTGNGRGLGLGGAKRLVSEFNIESTPGKGTSVTITRSR